MQIKMIVVMLLAVLISATGLAESATTSSISQHGITWNFDTAYEYGQFANGDYWVVGPVTITSIIPEYDAGTQRNGWEVNPVVDGNQGFDGRVGTGTFDSRLILRLPYTSGQNIESIVKVISAAESSVSYVQTAAVLTVLTEMPTNNGSTVFRPPYMGTTKPLYGIGDLHTEYLPSLASVGSPPSLATVESRYRYLRLEHMTYDQRSIRPRNAYGGVSDGYAPDCTKHNADDIARLCLNDSLNDKMDALVSVTQHGIDQAYAVIGGMRSPGTGHDPGHALMAAFAAVMLDITEAKTVLQSATGFEEDNYITKIADVSLWGQTNTETAYWDYIRGGGGNRANRDPYGLIDGGGCGAAYQLVVSQNCKGTVLIGDLIPEIASQAWNPTTWANLEEYVARWVNTGVWAQPDPCAPVGGTYGVDYGPDPDDTPYDCILDDDVDYFNSIDDWACTDGQNCGRFPSNHGTYADGGQYKSDFVADMWDAYYDGSVYHGAPPRPTNLRIIE